MIFADLQILASVFLSLDTFLFISALTEHQNNG